MQLDFDAFMQLWLCVGVGLPADFSYSMRPGLRGWCAQRVFEIQCKTNTKHISKEYAPFQKFGVWLGSLTFGCSCDVAVCRNAAHGKPSASDAHPFEGVGDVCGLRFRARALRLVLFDPVLKLFMQSWSMSVLCCRQMCFNSMQPRMVAVCGALRT